MIILLCISVILALCSCLIVIKAIWYDKHGMKYTLTDNSITAEWDFESPLTQLKLLKLFIQGEFMSETRNKYIREYSRLKKSLKDAGYDVSENPDYTNK